MTGEAAPSAPPTSLNVTEVTSSSITIQLGEVACIHRNGDMTGCSVQYGTQGSGNKAEVTIFGTVGSSGGTCTVTGLMAVTGYDIEVAAVTSAGAGVYSHSITVFTASDGPQSESEGPGGHTVHVGVSAAVILMGGSVVAVVLITLTCTLLSKKSSRRTVEEGRPRPTGTTHAYGRMREDDGEREVKDNNDPVEGSRYVITLETSRSVMSHSVPTTPSHPGKAGPYEPSPSKSGPKQLKIGRYILGETLGHGSFGKVKLAEHELTGHKVAVKILNRQKIKSLDVQEKIRREIQLLKLFRHPHIIKLYEVISTPTDIFMIMEYISGGELFDFIVKKGKSSEPEARKVFQQIISGVHYCHRHKVVHRDLKPENLLLDSLNRVKIADFGLSNLMKDGEFLRTSCGSPNYAAPEVVSGKLYAGPEVDVWSCGVILYALLCGTLPFDDRNVTMLFKKIKAGNYYVPPHLSQDVVDLLSEMLQVNPVKRITILGIMEHPWFKVDLPSYLFPLGDTAVSQIDSVALSEVCQKLSVPAHEVIGALRSGNNNDPLAVAYQLVLDNKVVLQAAHEALTQETVTASPPATPGLSSDVLPRSPAKPVSLTTGGSSTVPNMPRTFKRSKWHLGIRSQSRPQDIMAEIFRKLKALDFQWKIITPYFIRCRHNHPNSGVVIKLDLQLYQIDPKNYLLDFKCVNPDDKEYYSAGGEADRHHTMEFFEICSKLIASLAQ